MTNPMQSEQINELVTALVKVQGQLTHATKDSDNTFHKSRYADLASVWQACREPLSKNGLSVIQTLDFVDGKQALSTLLAHTSGQWIKSVMALPINKPGPQEVVSCVTYCRRTALAAIVGVYQADDDAEAATKPFRDNPTTHKPQTSPNNELDKIISDEQCDVLDTYLDKITDKQYLKDLNEYLIARYDIESIYHLKNNDYHKVIKSLENKIKNPEMKNGSERVA
ncbi:MAG TPA: ERF family protein [Rhabdochlamydiaceae bacterium]